METKQKILLAAAVLAIVGVAVFAFNPTLFQGRMGRLDRENLNRGGRAPAPAPVQEEVLYGDVNMDTVVDSMDSSCFAELLASQDIGYSSAGVPLEDLASVTLPECFLAHLKNADMNCNGTLELADQTLIMYVGYAPDGLPGDVDNDNNDIPDDCEN